MTTIGILLAIPEPYGGELRARRAAYGDTQARTVPAHVTLLPPTEVEPEAVPRIERHLAAIAARGRPFTMRLRGTGTFRPVSQVVFVRVERGLLECVELEAQMRSGLLERELQFPYHPHVTVAHDLGPAALDAAEGDLADFEAEFEINGFGLYRLDQHGSWRAVRTFPFPAPVRAAA
ncbi:2'-5' RNA ligase family protein [Actinocrinis puniceicyclus]|uniref:2'-5' RNA ligase family protein n=1 Tax=Actinocrinis puniceicyclus TaxID=977794 RepID=A0A8J7WLL9_9ACTN|nr:2'-5' RNA ligase family protein [Actinocrinis puniceicyclus]MBS2961744.1 2'-5' RNA ligase family protein [Actinocrinis puniceicyclus]